MLAVTDVSGRIVEIVYNGEDLQEAWLALREDLINTATVGYSVPVVEWWFTDHSQSLEVIHPNGTVDVWVWK